MAQAGTIKGAINNERENLPELQLKFDECFDDSDIGESKVKKICLAFVTNSL